MQVYAVTLKHKFDRSGIGPGRRVCNKREKREILLLLEKHRRCQKEGICRSLELFLPIDRRGANRRQTHLLLERPELLRYLRFALMIKLRSEVVFGRLRAVTEADTKETEFRSRDDEAGEAAAKAELGRKQKLCAVRCVCIVVVRHTAPRNSAPTKTTLGPTAKAVRTMSVRPTDRPHPTHALIE